MKHNLLRILVPGQSIKSTFFKKRRVIFTGSAIPLLIQADQESGVGRWHTLKISTLSFMSICKLKKSYCHPDTYSLFNRMNLFKLFNRGITSNFRGEFFFDRAFSLNNLVRGGFPQTALVESLTPNHKNYLREDIIDKVLKRDMTALFGVRRILELEQMFIFLCMHDGGQARTSQHFQK